MRPLRPTTSGDDKRREEKTALKRQRNSDFSSSSRNILRSLQCWPPPFECYAPLFCCVLPPFLPPDYYLLSRAYSCTLTCPTALTIVHCDGTYILSRHNSGVHLRWRLTTLEYCGSQLRPPLKHVSCNSSGIQKRLPMRYGYPLSKSGDLIPLCLPVTCQNGP
jgi:hypothetical protein